MPIVQPRHHAGDRHTPNAADPHVPRRRALAGTGFRTLIAVTVLGLVSLALTTPCRAPCWLRMSASGWMRPTGLAMGWPRPRPVVRGGACVVRLAA